MAVLPMRRIQICGLRKNRKQILEALQRRGVVELNDVIEEDSVFQRIDASPTRAVFEKNVQYAAQALAVLESYAPEKKGLLSSLEGRKELPVELYETYNAERDEIMRVVHEVLQLSKTIAEHKANIPKLEAQLESLNPWKGLDIPLDFKGTKTTSAFIGTLVGEATLESIYAQFAELAPEAETVNVDVVSSSKEQTCIVVLCSKSDAASVENALREMNFARPPLASRVLPTQRQEELQKEIEECQRIIDASEAEIRSYAGERNAFRFMIDYYTMRAEKYAVISRLAQSKRTFVLTGYIPERDAASLEQYLNDHYDLVVEVEVPGEEEDVPVLLKNNKFAAPVESVVESYSLPGRGEVDPTTIMACFYYVLFGMMLSDAAYGLIMVIACAACLLKFKGMESGMRKTLQMFMYCGISTTFWGFMFGSFFGDAVSVISSTFFHHEVSIPPIWFEPVEEPMRMLVFAFLIGIIHLFVGLGVKFYQAAKAGHWKDAVYDVVFWYMLVGGAILYLLTMTMFTDMLGIPFTLPAVVGTVSAVCAVVGAIGIVLTSGRESRNWGKRFLKGLYGVYGVTSYLSDILSYSRLLALGLATGVIATVFNKMGSMVGGGVVGAIVFILVFLIGHTLNLGINLLGAYVHTNRLQFVEFFGKFYEGGGRKFSPFAVNTKYYKIKEDI